MQRQEVPNNTPAQVGQYVSDALDLVAALDPPEDLRAAVFTAAVNLIASKQVVLTQPQQVPIDPRLFGIAGR